MPVDYSKGKIYKITSSHTDLVYIGSTCAPLLSQRLRGHVDNYRQWKEGKRHFISSFIVLDAGDHAIELLELFPCTCSDELRAREQHWIREHGERVCNRHKALRTEEEKRQEKCERNRERYQANKEIINEKNRERYQADRVRVIQKQREYTQANRDKIKEWRSEIVVCACGTQHIRGGKAKHLRSKKHQDYLRQQQPQVNEVAA